MYKIGDVILFTDWLFKNKIGTIDNIKIGTLMNIYIVSNYMVYEHEIIRKLTKLEKLVFDIDA